jgi:hypothetical protein
MPWVCVSPFGREGLARTHVAVAGGSFVAVSLGQLNREQLEVPHRWWKGRVGRASLQVGQTHKMQNEKDAAVCCQPCGRGLGIQSGRVECRVEHLCN